LAQAQKTKGLSPKMPGRSHGFEAGPGCPTTNNNKDITIHSICSIVDITITATGIIVYITITAITIIKI
jgi:hypothetical protein